MVFNGNKLVFILLLFNVMFTCKPKLDSLQNKQNLYFDFSQVLDFQKKMYLNRPMEVIKLTTDSQTVVVSDWDKELGLFYTFNLNLPKSRGAYKVGAIVRENEIKHIYHLKKDQKAEVRQMVISFDTLENLKSIQAVIQVDKWLYHTSKRVTLLFDRHNEQKIGPLRSYKIEGNQGFVYFKDHAFQISCTVLYPNAN